MSDIRHVILSDLHFGAPNSVLTALTRDRSALDLSRPSTTLLHLVDCLHALVAANESPGRPHLVLGGDVLEFALALENQAAVVFERFMEATFGADRLFDDRVVYVPGNHDHHLWEGAREAQYVANVASLGADEPLPPPWHVTSMVELDGSPAVTAPFLNALVNRHQSLRGVSVEMRYPNLALVTPDRERIAVFHHGHYIESMYRLITHIRRMLFHRAESNAIEDWEAENFAWVDFFWSMLGRSGEAGRDVAAAYDLLQSEESADLLVQNLARGIGEKIDSGALRRAAVPAARLLLGQVAEHFVGRERQNSGSALSDDASVGLRRYLERPVLDAIGRELDGHYPARTTFLFGHTHKPFVGSQRFGGYHEEVALANTGGWVVDDPAPEPIHGAAAVLLDEQLDAVLVTFFRQGPDAADYRPTVEPLPGSEQSDFARRMSELVNADAPPWTGLSAAAAKAVHDRNIVLADVIDRAVVDAQDPRHL